MWVGLTILSLLQTIEDMIATTKDVVMYVPSSLRDFITFNHGWLAVFIFCRIWNKLIPSLVTQLSIFSSVQAVTLIIFP